jgi:uncharacterized membrane protein
MSFITRTLAGAAISAAAMYWLDPASGRRRRALLRDQLRHVSTSFSDGVGMASRDITHRMRGMSARARSRFTTEEAIDEVIVERVRSALGRVCSHPGSVDVSVERGWVTMNGPVLADEHQPLLRAVRMVRGVQGVRDLMAVHTSAEGISALQGGSRRIPRGELSQENWSPATRLVAGSSGAVIALCGARALFSRDGSGFLGAIALVGGGLLMARSSANAPIRRLAGLSGRRAIDIHKTLHVNAPLEQVFETLAHYENFPSFMRNVRDVRMHEDGRSHWVVAGPGGMSVEWDAETTIHEPNELLAWRTVANAKVEHAGIIRFERSGQGTRLDIQMSYNPPAGALGHIVAKMFGSDAKTELDQDLMRLKSFLETGVPARDAARRGDSIPTLQPSSAHTREVH